MASIIESLSEYFLRCPLLKDGYFHVDFLGPDPVEYTLEVLPCDPIVKRYVNGDTLRRYLFAFGSREYYSADRTQNIENIAFYEEMSDWVEEQTHMEDFPKLPEGLYPEGLRTVSSGYLFDESMENARYQIQIELIYYKEADHGESQFSKAAPVR